VALRELSLAAEGGSLDVGARPTMSFQGNMQVAVAEARAVVGRAGAWCASRRPRGNWSGWRRSSRNTPCRSSSRSSLPTARHPTWRSGPIWRLGGQHLPGEGLIRRGVVFPGERLAVFGSEDLFGATQWASQRMPAKSGLSAFAADLADLKPGDHVVHAEHGVGRFVGLREIGQGEQQGDYMLLEYAGEARLYLPLTRLDLIQKFRGAGEHVPALDRLGGATWARTKTRIKARLRDMADELLKLYAGRQLAQGFSFPRRQLAAGVRGRLRVRRDRRPGERDSRHQADMEHQQPMDRLLCGDVGFGKTEVAMRAAFKALGDGKQVAVLAPTTVLCFQHYETFRRRFAPFPVRVEMLSRFRSRKEIAAVLADAADGKVDILIGTHRCYPRTWSSASWGC